MGQNITFLYNKIFSKSTEKLVKRLPMDQRTDGQMELN